MSNKIDVRDYLRKRIHPLLLKIMPGRRNFPLKILNHMSAIPGNKIFVMNHSTSQDAPIASEVIQEHFYLLVGKQSLEIMDRVFFFLNGVVYVDRKNKDSKRRGLKKMMKILENGHNLLIYPEGTWNMTPSKPMLPLNWGVIELAKNTKTPIVPLIAEYHPECCYVKFGEAIYIHEETDKKAGIEQLEDIMATLKWDIWEMLPKEKRQDKLKEEFEQQMQQRIMEYPKLDAEYEKSLIRGLLDSPEYVLRVRG